MTISDEFIKTYKIDGIRNQLIDINDKLLSQKLHDLILWMIPYRSLASYQPYSTCPAWTEVKNGGKIPLKPGVYGSGRVS